MTERDIFLAAIDLADPAAQASYLEKMCGKDTALRGRVEGLLRSHIEAGSFLGTPAVAPPDSDHVTTRTLSPTPHPDAESTRTSDGGAQAEDEVPLTFLASPQRPDSLGRIGHYEVLEVLGKGGFGIVFRAFDDVLHRVVAVKVLSPQMAATSPARKRFLREARSSAQVRHENVVQVYEVGEQPLPYITMEFIPGETLQQRLNRIGPIDVAEVVRIGRQIAEGLAAAHATDLIHRDIKPGNVLLEGATQRVKITDFGLARAADDASISQSGIIAGTPMYMAPEQAKGETLDQRADLFSLGSVLYQMVAGRSPFRATGTLAVLKRVAEDTPRPIREIIPETPQWLCDIIAKLHAKNPDERYQSAREVAEVLADCEAQLKANAKLKDYSRIPSSKPRQSGRGKWLAAVAVGMVVLAGLGVWFGKAGVLLLSNKGELEILPEQGLISVIVLHNDEGVIDDNKLHDIATDWMDMKQRQTLKLSPGRYQLNVRTWPEGMAVGEWEVTSSGLFGSNRITVPVVSSSAIITVERGDQIRLRASMRDGTISRKADPTTTSFMHDDPEYTNTLGMKFKLIPAGKFTMGSAKEEIDRCLELASGGWVKDRLLSEGPEHPVEITQPFYMGATEVTVGQFRQFVDEGGYQVGDGRWRNPGFDQRGNHPVIWVSWQNAVDFCNWLSKKEGKTYRLPTEAEWEYSCRAGKSGIRYCYGNDDSQLEDYAWYNMNSGHGTHPVEKKKPNEWGLYDMHGNVGEWCQDHYDPNYYNTTPKQDPRGPGDGDERVLRGGAWGREPFMCRSAFRNHAAPDSRYDDIGFRVLLVSPPGSVRTESGVKDKPAPLAIAPFDAAQARAHQEAWAKYLGVPAEFTNSAGMKLRLIPPGKFTMGSPKEEIERCLKLVGNEREEAQPDMEWEKERLPTEGPEHEVEITQSFYLGATEVTVGQFRQFVDEEGYQVGDDCWRNPGFDQKDNHPVVCVTWKNAVDFCNWLSKKEGKSYRLPTEAEWEYSCRAGKSRTRYCYGNDDAQLENYAWFYKDAGGGTHPVGKKKPNDWGLYDMHGNAWELCQDCFDPSYYKNSLVKDPPGGTSPGRVMRGGSWWDGSIRCRCAFRGEYGFDTRSVGAGFRVLLVSPPGGVWPESGVKDKPAPTAIAPFTDANVRRIAALSADEQVEEVRKELMRRNLGFDGKVEHKIEDGVITEIRVVTDKVKDISPLRVFNALRVLDCSGTHTSDWHGNGQLADLTQLKGMNFAGLKALRLGWTQVGDEGMSDFKDCKELISLLLTGTRITNAGLAHFKDCKDLTELGLDGTKVSDAGLACFKDCEKLTFLYLHCAQVGDAGMAFFRDCKNLSFLDLGETKVTNVGLACFKDCTDLRTLNLFYTETSDAGLTYFKGCDKLTVLFIHRTKITDLSLLRGMPLKELNCDFKPDRDSEILRSVKTLERINDKPAAEFWKDVEQKRATEQAWLKRIAALPAAEQVEAVSAKLKDLNPGFDGKVEHKIEDGGITEFKIVTDKVTDISPIRVFSGLRVLDCSGTHNAWVRGNGLLADLTPLKGMNFSHLINLNLNWTKVDDAGLAHFKDCNGLTGLELRYTKVTDAGLARFKDCKNLTYLDLGRTQVTNAGLAQFKDCKNLTSLSLPATEVGDAGLAYFKDCKDLTFLDLSDTQVSDVGLAYFKDCKNLRSVLVNWAAKVTDAGLAHFKDCNDLTQVYIDHTKVTDLSLLRGMHLKDLKCDFQPERDAEILRSIKTLETINGKPVEEFWKSVEKK